MYILIPIPISNWKNQGFPIPIPIPSQCGNSPSKRGRIRTIPTEAGLFAISTCLVFIFSLPFNFLGSDSNAFARHWKWQHLYLSLLLYLLPFEIKITETTNAMFINFSFYSHKDLGCSSAYTVFIFFSFSFFKKLLLPHSRR